MSSRNFISMFTVFVKKLFSIKLSDLRYYVQSYSPNEISKADWESQYLHKHWDYLKDINELAHYSIITGYCNYLKVQGSILDVGCGQGVLQERLRSSYQYSQYVGLDISNEAINSASKRQDKRTVFLCSDVSRFTIDMKFDIIIFNEVLYYLEDPIGLLRQYERFLKNDGVIIVSMYSSGRNKRIWSMIEKNYKLIDAVVIKHHSGISWMISLLKSNDKTYVI